MTTPTPSHISPSPDSKHHLCGVKHDQLPYVAAAHVQSHVDGWGMTVCADCWQIHTGNEPELEPPAPIVIPGQLDIFGGVA